MKFLGLILSTALLFQVVPVARAQMSHGAGQAKMPAVQEAAAVKVTAPWARASSKRARTAVAYLTLENAGETSDKLVSASSPMAGRAELHTHIRDGDIFRMRQVQSIEVGPKSTVRLQPGGLHLMLIGLKGPLEKGSRFPLTLVFEKAGAMTFDVTIQSAGAMGVESGHENGGGMNH